MFAGKRVATQPPLLPYGYIQVSVSRRQAGCASLRVLGKPEPSPTSNVEPVTPPIAPKAPPWFVMRCATRCSRKAAASFTANTSSTGSRCARSMPTTRRSRCMAEVVGGGGGAAAAAAATSGTAAAAAASATAAAATLAAAACSSVLAVASTSSSVISGVLPLMLVLLFVSLLLLLLGTGPGAAVGTGGDPAAAAGLAPLVLPLDLRDTYINDDFESYILVHACAVCCSRSKGQPAAETSKQAMHLR